MSPLFIIENFIWLDIILTAIVLSVKGGKKMKRTQQEVLDLYEKYYEMVWRICLVRFGNTHDAYDAAQETFVRLMSDTKSFHNEEHEKAWLIRTAINYCKDVMKSSHWKREIGLDGGKPPEAGVVPNEYSEVYEAMMELPEKYRVILYLHYYEGYSQKEIARMMKTNASTLRSRFAKAKELMKVYLEEEMPKEQGKCEVLQKCFPDEKGAVL